MNQRRYVVTAVILCLGTAASLGAFLLAQKLSFMFERSTFDARAAERVDSLIDEFSETQKLVIAAGEELSREGDVTESRFVAVTQRLLSHPNITRADWAPLVKPREHEAFLEGIRARYGEDIELTRLNGRGKRQNVKLPNKRRLFPVLLAAPSKNARSVAGFDRGVRPGDSDHPILAPRKKFYPAASPQAGISLFVYSDTPERPTLGVLAVTFADKLFDVSHETASEQPILIRITDVTGRRKPIVASDFREEHIRRENSKNDGSNAEVFFARTATVGGYTFREAGGRAFRFDCRQNPNFSLRPTWLPYTTFFSGLIVTALCACHWTTRNTHQLELLNMKLRREIEERKEMQRALQSVLEFREQERELVAHDIHDGFVQQVVGAQMFVQGATSRLNGQAEACRRDLTTATDLLAKAIDDGRRMITDLKPSVVDELGLVEAVKDLVSEEGENFGLSITFRHSANFERLPQLVERTLFRVIQETLTNVKRHSGVDEATVSLVHSDSSVIVEVKDRGRGFELSSIEDGRFGVRGIQERARLLQGHATISSAPNEGTCVTVEIPLTSPGFISCPKPPQRRISAVIPS